jgi:UDP-N-acetylmuramate--alanine ligase
METIQKAHAKVHIIGIGGIGMSAIAGVLYKAGIYVQGSDMRDNEITQDLKRIGVRCFMGHHAANIEHADIVVYSTAVKADNVEYTAALRANKLLLSRHQILSKILSHSSNILISGSHGKTTTTSMLARIFDFRKQNDFIAIVGGVMEHNQSNFISHGGTDFKWAIVEADESDSTFVQIPANVAIITNISAEHLDQHGTLDDLCRKFTLFLQNLPADGFGLVCIDDVEICKILGKITDKRRRVVTYSTSNRNADYYAANISKSLADNPCSPTISFDVYFESAYLASFVLNIHGVFNVGNCLAAIATCNELQIDMTLVRHALADFRTTKRRFEVIGRYREAIVINDYAVHPCELTVVIQTAYELKQAYQTRLFVCFEPHRYTRLCCLHNEFVRVLSSPVIDHLIILPVYGSGEPIIDGVDSRRLATSITRTQNSNCDRVTLCEHSISSLETVIGDLKPNKNDILIFIGAGDVYRLSQELLR